MDVVYVMQSVARYRMGEMTPPNGCLAVEVPLLHLKSVRTEPPLSPVHWPRRLVPEPKRTQSMRTTTELELRSELASGPNPEAARRIYPGLIWAIVPGVRSGLGQCNPTGC